jgi:hypothetical protein
MASEAMTVAARWCRRATGCVPVGATQAWRTASRSGPRHARRAARGTAHRRRKPRA